MKIDFIKEYDSVNPKDGILRIFDFNSEEVKKLISIFRDLTKGNLSKIDLRQHTFISPVGGVNLVLQLGSIDKGIIQKSYNDFVCSLSKSGWEDAIDLAQPFSKSEDINGHQWLYDLNTDIDFHLSRNGKW